MLETCAKNTEEAMLTKIGTITVQVTDQDKALEFYTQKLGFEKRNERCERRTGGRRKGPKKTPARI